MKANFLIFCFIRKNNICKKIKNRKKKMIAISGFIIIGVS